MRTSGRVNTRVISLLVGAGVLCFCAYAYVNNRAQSSPVLAQTVDGSGWAQRRMMPVPVVYARKTIPKGSVIKSDQVGTNQVAESDVPANAVASVESVIGRVAKVTIAARSPISTANLENVPAKKTAPAKKKHAQP